MTLVYSFGKSGFISERYLQPPSILSFGIRYQCFEVGVSLAT